MTPLQQAWHLANFLAPAAFTAAIAVTMAKLLWRRELAGAGWLGLTLWSAMAGEAAMVAGWMLAGRDGAMATYASMVLAVALAIWVAGLRLRRAAPG
jgi:hypothetical protein